MMPIPPPMPAATPGTAVALTAAHQHTGQVTVLWLLFIATIFFIIVFTILFLSLKK